MKLNITTENNWLEATWYEEVQQEENISRVQVHCESFSGHKEHISMLRNKAKEFDTSLDEYEDIIKEVSDSFRYPTQEELDKEELANKIQEALTFLAKTDNREFPSYIPKDGENVAETIAKRVEARQFIRENR